MKYSFLLLVPFLFPSCLSYEEIVLKEVRSVELQRIDSAGIVFTVEAVIENPNSYRVKARDPDVDLFVNGSAIGKAMLDTVLTLDKRSSRAYFVPVRAQLTEAQMVSILLASAFTGEARLRAEGTIVGQAGLFKRRFPFAVEQTLDLQQ